MPDLPDGTRTALAPYLTATADGSAVRLPTGTFTFNDFSQYLLGVNLGSQKTGLIGTGSSRTILTMTPHTSTKADRVPTIPWTTNQLYLMSVSGSPTLQGFTLQGSDQGHLFNGLRVGQATDARVSDVHVNAIPGNASMPPGETFGFNDWRTTGSRYSNIQVDGRGISAAGFASNNSSDLTIDNGYFHDNQGGGAVFWQSDNITLNNVHVADNRTGLNFERVSGNIVINHPNLENNRGQDMYFGTDRGSAKITIIDPVFTGPQLRIQIPKTYMGSPATQLRSDLRVIINGVDRTADVVHWVGG